MNRTEHREHRYDGTEDRRGRLVMSERSEGGPGAPPNEDRTARRAVPTHPPVRSVTVWGPIAAFTLLAFLITIGVWRRTQERGQEKAFKPKAHRRGQRASERECWMLDT
jgi:hypothetical protein